MPRIIPCTVAPSVNVGDVASREEVPAAARSRSRRIHRLRQTEVEDLHLPFNGSFYVLRLQIAMDDPFLVRLFQGLGDLASDGEAFI